MAETINNNASTVYTFSGSSTSSIATSNSLPINFESSTGLSITKTPSVSTFSPGDIITYTISISNSSSSYLTGVRIIDNLGYGNLAYVVGSAKLTTSSQTYSVTPIATNPLTFTLQQLNTGSMMTLTYKCQVIYNLPSTVSLITNSVQAIGYTYSGTISGFASSTIQKKSSVDFSITKSSNVTDVGPSQNFNYYLTLTNNTSTLVNISSITDNLPSNYSLVSIKLSVGGSSEVTLGSSDYTLSSSNTLQVPSATGPVITVPANSSTIVTLTGYFS